MFNNFEWSLEGECFDICRMVTRIQINLLDEALCYCLHVPENFIVVNSVILLNFNFCSSSYIMAGVGY